MEEYKRFTQWTENGAGLKLDNPQNNEEARKQLMEKFKLACNFLAELEDKIENGTLIELPCKVEDKIYFENWEDNGSTSIGVQGHTVTGFEINFIINGRYGNTYIPTRAVGIDVFLTKAEAEAKLKELQNER